MPLGLVQGLLIFVRKCPSGGPGPPLLIWAQLKKNGPLMESWGFMVLSTKPVVLLIKGVLTCYAPGTGPGTMNFGQKGSKWRTKTPSSDLGPTKEKWTSDGKLGTRGAKYKNCGSSH